MDYLRKVGGLRQALPLEQQAANRMAGNEQNPFLSNLSSATYGYGGSSLLGLSNLAEVAGADNLARGLRSRSDSLLNTAGQNATDSVSLDSVKDFGSFVQSARANMGQGFGSMAPIIAAAPLGLAPGLAAATLPMYGENIGTLEGDEALSGMTAGQKALHAAPAAAVQGAMNYVVPGGMAGQLGKNIAARTGTGALGKAGTVLGTNMLVEGATEAGEELTRQGMHSAANPLRDKSGDTKELIQAAYSGALGGAPIGGAQAAGGYLQDKWDERDQRTPAQRAADTVADRGTDRGMAEGESITSAYEAAVQAEAQQRGVPVGQVELERLQRRQAAEATLIASYTPPPNATDADIAAGLMADDAAKQQAAETLVPEILNDANATLGERQAAQNYQRNKEVGATNAAEQLGAELSLTRRMADSAVNTASDVMTKMGFPPAPARRGNAQELGSRGNAQEPIKSLKDLGRLVAANSEAAVMNRLERWLVDDQRQTDLAGQLDAALQRPQLTRSERVGQLASSFLPDTAEIRALPMKEVRRLDLALQMFVEGEGSPETRTLFDRLFGSPEVTEQVLEMYREPSSDTSSPLASEVVTQADRTVTDEDGAARAPVESGPEPLTLDVRTQQMGQNITGIEFPFELRRQEAAKAELETAQAELERVRTMEDPATLAEAEARVSQAFAAAQQPRRKYFDTQDTDQRALMERAREALSRPGKDDADVEVRELGVVEREIEARGVEGAAEIERVQLEVVNDILPLAQMTLPPAHADRQARAAFEKELARRVRFANTRFKSLVASKTEFEAGPLDFTEQDLKDIALNTGKAGLNNPKFSPTNGTLVFERPGFKTPLVTSAPKLIVKMTTKRGRNSVIDDMPRPEEQYLLLTQGITAVVEKLGGRVGYVMRGEPVWLSGRQELPDNFKLREIDGSRITYGDVITSRAQRAETEARSDGWVADVMQKHLDANGSNMAKADRARLVKVLNAYRANPNNALVVGQLKALQREMIGGVFGLGEDITSRAEVPSESEVYTDDATGLPLDRGLNAYDNNEKIERDDSGRASSNPGYNVVGTPTPVNTARSEPLRPNTVQAGVAERSVPDDGFGNRVATTTIKAGRSGAPTTAQDKSLDKGGAQPTRSTPERAQSRLVETVKAAHKDFLEVVGKNSGRSLRQPTQQELSTVIAQLAEMEKRLGYAAVTQDGVINRIAVITGEGTMGTMSVRNDLRLLSLNETVFTDKNLLPELNETQARRLERVVSHELGHALDSTGVYSSKATFNPGGNLYQEAMASREKSAYHNKMFGHIDGMATANREMFAQLFSMYLTNKEVMSETLPRAFGAFERVFGTGRRAESTGQNNQVGQRGERGVPAGRREDAAQATQAEVGARRGNAQTPTNGENNGARGQTESTGQSENSRGDVATDVESGFVGVGAPKQRGEGFARRVAKVSEQFRFEKPGERLDHEGKLSAFNGYTTVAAFVQEANSFVMFVLPKESVAEVKALYETAVSNGATVGPTLLHRIYGHVAVARLGYDLDGSFTMLAADKGSFGASLLEQRNVLGETTDRTGRKLNKFEGLSFTQLVSLLGEFHARIKTANGGEAVSINWDRYTGANTDKTGQTKFNQQSTQTPSNKPSDPAEMTKALEEVKRLLGKDFKVEAAQDLKGPDGTPWSGEQQDGLIKIAMLAEDKVGVGRHEALHQMFQWLRQNGGQDVIRTIENMATNEAMQRRLKTLLAEHPNATKQLKDPEEAAAYLFQFWMAEQIQVGPKTQTLFQKILAYLNDLQLAIREKVFGSQAAIKQRTANKQAELVNNLMSQLAEGALANSKTRVSVIEVLNNNVKAVEQKRANVKAFGGKFHKGLQKWVYSAASVFEDSDNVYVQNLGKRLFRMEGDERGRMQNYLERFAQVNDRYQVRIRNIYHGLDKDTLKLVGKYLTEERPLDQIHHEEARKVVEQVREYYKDLLLYQKDAGTSRWDESKREWVPMGEIKGIFNPRVWSVDALLAKQDAFMKKLIPALEAERKRGGFKDFKEFNAEEMAKAIYANLINGVGVDQVSTDELAGGARPITETNEDIGITPYHASVNKRDLAFLDAKEFAEFLSQDPIEQITNYTAQAVKRAEYVRDFGNGGENIRMELHKAMLLEMGLKKGEIATLPEKLKRALKDWGSQKRALGDDFTQPKPTLLSLGKKRLSERVRQEVYEANKAELDALAPAKAVTAATAESTAQMKAMTKRLDKLTQEKIDALQLEAAKKLENVALAIQAVEGTLGHDIDPKLRQVMSGVTTFQNFRLLPLALFSSINDIVGTVARGGEMKDAFNALQRGVKEVRLMWKGEFSQDYYAKLAEQIGTVGGGNYLDAMGQTYSSQFMYGRMRRLNDALFRWNGLEAWNRASRIAATEAAVNFIKRHVEKPNEHSKRYLEELFGKDYDTSLIMKDGDLDYSNDRVREAVLAWVNGAILRPNAAHRPIHASDPHYMLLYHLKQFAYSFHKVILRRAWVEAQNGNYTPAAALFVGYVPVTIAADLVKELLIVGDDDPWWTKQGLTTVLGHGLGRAQLGGIPQLWLGDTAGDPLTLFSSPDVWASRISNVAGPAPDQLIDLLTTPLFDNKTITKELAGGVPGGVILRRYVD